MHSVGLGAPAKRSARNQATCAGTLEDVQRIRSISELEGRYDAVLCDVWGVLHDGRHPYPGVIEALTGLRASGTIVLLLTNVPRPAHEIPAALAHIGIPDTCWDAAVTSGDLMRVELARRSPGPVHRLGRETDPGLWDGLGLEFSGLKAARFVAIAGLRGPEEAPADYLPVLRAAHARNLELLCANPDVRVPTGSGFGWCAGAVAQEYALLGGRVTMAGKPYAPIYERARSELDRAAHRSVPKERILAIGDGITTDILGANRVGLHSLLIASGVNGDALLTEGRLDLDKAVAAVRAAGANATYVAERLS